MANDATPAPSVRMAYDVSNLVGVSPDELSGYVIVYLTVNDFTGIVTAGVDASEALGILLSGVHQMFQQPEPDIRFGPEP